MPELKLAACAGAHSKGSDPQGLVALYGLDFAAGRVREISRSSAAQSPSFLAWQEQKNTLYVASELPKGDGRVTGMRLEADSFNAGRSAPTGGTGAVHLCLDRQDNWLFVANYQPDNTTGPASVAVFALEADGRLGPMSGSASHEGHGAEATRQSRPHCHSVTISPDNRLLVAADLGTDSLWLYRFDAGNGSIALAREVRLPAGTGPRHCVFHPARPLLYLTGELNSSLMTIAVDTARADAHVIENVPATERETEQRNYPSGIAISPDGHYLLAANRNADTIAVYWTDPATGVARMRSETACGGAFPRAIRLDPTGRWLAVANQLSNSISIFSRDFASGLLSETPVIQFDIQSPLDMIFLDQ